ncbi:MAG: gliding motility-associated C-terminal domain-containing protein [Chitinophagales bacterium]|nr:gliding motility-associated C-terminal domain-containing protein [Chitinophagales bacterium]
MAKQYLLLTLTILSFTALKAQNYTLLGSASAMSGCNCFQLTPDAGNQAGAIFQNNTINLNNSFDFTFNVFLGCNGSNGADGMVFVLTSNPNGMGQPGEAMGYASGGNQPFSLAVEFDTWQNGSPANDPSSDHIGINSGGQYNHNVSPAVSAQPGGGNIDDCGWHVVRIVWDVNTNTFTVYFDGVIRQQIVIPNMVNQYFGGNPIVNWGWSGATGGGTNLQQVCVQNTSNWVAGVNYQSCSTTMQFQDVSTSSLGSVASWAWNFGDGGTSNLQNPTHTYAANGTYTVTLTVTDITGCTNTYSHPVVINPPIALSPNIQQPPCNGGTNGSINLTPSGGFGPSAGYGGYTYQWSTGFSGATAVGVGAGTYTVTATDGVCTTTAQYNVNQPPPLTATTSSTNAPCGGNGTATIVISGGTPPYNNVTWAGFPGYTVSLPAGTWIANFNDANGCSALLQYTTTISQLPCGVNSSTTSTNVTCFGGNNGSITLTVTGITGTPNVSWSNGGSGFTISGLTQGTYTYNYTDSDPAHAFSGTVVITQPGAPMVASMSTVNTSCAGINNGQAIASVPSGGTSPYTYTWSNGAPNNPVANNLAPGPISVTVTGANGCTATASGVVNNPPTLSLTITAVNDSCYQSNKGSATANPSGGTPPYTYYWSNISSAQTNLGLGVGTYTVTVTDDNGCTVTGTVTINQPPAFSHTISSQNINCFGNNTGSITVNPAGGSPAYTYTWNPATASGSNPQNLSAGLYNVTITDANQCQRTDAVTISQPASALTATSSHTNVTCFGANNGSITLTVGGGSPPYSFQGNPVPPGTTTLPNLPPNTYAGNLTDANGCSVALSETITQPAQLTLTETHINVSCNGGNNGSIDVTVNGGTTPYSYLWNDGNTNQDRTGLAIGTYTLTATDFNTCTATVSVTLTEPSALSISETHVNVLCNGNPTGSIDITVNGGSPNYTYLWNDGNTNEDRTNIAAANYSVTATDANSCTISTSVTITQPTALSASSSHTNVTCFGANDGSITLTVGGGTAPYSFQGNPVPSGTTTLPNLPPNTYAGNLTDANGCLVALSETITEPTQISITETHIDATCNGASNGSIDVSVLGGTSPYTYLWNDGNTNQDRTNITAAVYSVTVTDLNTCTASISVTVSEPPAPVMTVTVTDATCFGANGSATANPVAGNGAFTFAWSAGSSTTQTVSLPQGNYTVTATDALQCNQTAAFTINQPADIVPNETLTHINCTGDATGAISFNPSGGNGAPYSYVWNPNVGTGNTASLLVAGSYAVTITDQLNCPKQVTVVLNEPAQALTINIQSNNVTCFGLDNGSITISTTGGMPNYSYSWNPAVSTGNSATGLSPANYVITVSDFNNCSVVANVTISEPNQPLTVTPSFTPLSCFQSNDGTATFNTTGGSFPYQYAWTPNVSTTSAASSLSAGLYSVVVTDNNGCTTNSSTTVTQPTAVNASESHSGIACAGDTSSVVTITPSGGTPGTTGYTFSWNPNVSNTNTATVNAGSYTVIVADSNNCTVSVAVSITEPNPLTVTSTFTNVTCFGANDATITGTAAGGTLPYGYSITQDGVNFTNSSNGFFGGVMPGTYTLLANDSNGCTVTMLVTVTQPTQLLDNVVATDATCFGYSDGQVVISGTGGSAPYNYSLSNSTSNTTGVFTGLASGNYNTTLTDANGCTVTNSITITEPAELTIDAQPTPATIKLGESVQINTTTNQTGSVTYTWSPSFGLSCTDCANPLFEGIYSQVYTVIAVNQQGCSGSAQINVTVVPNYDIFFPNAFSPGNNDGANDYWQIYGNLNAIKQINVMVFNRIGEKVFESNDIYFKWDGLYKGEPVQPNVYVYTAQIVWLNNHSDSKYKGTITIVK